MSTICAKTRLVFFIGLSLVLLTNPVACASQSTVTPTVEVPTALSPTVIPPSVTASTPTPSTPSPIVLLPETSVQTGPMYSFENFANGWTPEAYYSTMACIQVSNSTEIVKDGQYSLKLQMNLIGNNEQNNRGEAWVDMRNYPPSAAKNPFVSLDLNNRTITMWVYAPAGAIGDSSKPNGLQIFVKDVHWNGSYSTWTNVVENEWVQLSFTVSTSVVENGYMEQGFDPSQIIAVGLKMGAGGESTVAYQGPIYVDSVDW